MMIPKNFILKFASISYSGKSIGNDLRIEIQTRDQKLNIDISLDLENTTDINKEIGIFAADQESFVLPVNITIIEKDPIFDDVKNEIFHIPINLSYGIKQTIDYPKEPWKKGNYEIGIPDYPHDIASSYLDKAPKALVWFRIGHDDEKYIHTGQRTLGCITVTEHEKWEEVYENLIRARKGDSRSVGILEVID